MCKSDYETKLFHEASLLVFFVALQISKLVATNKADRSRRALELGDISFLGARITIHIHVSKTDWGGKGRVVCLDAFADPALCPLRAMR